MQRNLSSVDGHGALARYPSVRATAPVPVKGVKVRSQRPVLAQIRGTDGKERFELPPTIQPGGGRNRLL
jgi:hypothetical protein